MIFIRDFGAIGDGITDDYVNIQAAVDASEKEQVEELGECDTMEDITQAFVEYVSRELDSGKYERHNKPWYRKERW